jgi:UMF1 family MFS transporter
VKQVLRRRPVIAWALCDWANSAFATTVMAGFFPVFFKQYWNVGVDATTSTMRLGLTNGIASACVALLAPVLGAIADRSASRVRLLMVFTVLGAASTAALALVGHGHWLLAAALFLAAGLGFWGGVVFNDSLLLHVAEPDEYDLVSGFGYSLGYLGGGLLFALNVAMTLRPQLFGLADATAAVRASFVTVGVWWFVFTLPLVRYVHEPAAVPADGSVRLGLVGSVRQAFRELGSTFAHVRAYRPGALVPRGVLALHRRRQHDRQDGGRLRALAGLRFVEPARGTVVDAVRRVPGRTRVWLARPAYRSAQRHLYRPCGVRRGDRLRVFPPRRS